MEKRKNYNYIEEKDNKKTLIGIFAVLLLFNVVVLIEKAYAAFLAILVVDILIMLCCGFAFNKRKKFLERKKEIIRNGLKVSGKIIGEELINAYEDTHGRIKYDRCLNIEYFYSNRKMTYQTPAISFSKQDLISDDVDVYIFESEIYVDNFKFN